METLTLEEKALLFLIENPNLCFVCGVHASADGYCSYCEEHIDGRDE